ncbi:MAG: hypothetical protein K2H65_01650, partial [Bacteroidales bacterium]|nr:hypothetical protein [Bacteroidales bacterium]
MDKKSIIGLILIFLVMMGYAYWTSPSLEERQAAQEEAARKAAEQTAAAMPAETPEAVSGPTTPVETEAAAPADPDHPFSLAMTGETADYTVEN